MSFDAPIAPDQRDHGTDASVAAVAGYAAALAQAVAAPGRRYFTAALALELGVLLALSVLLPFSIHLLPVPEEARLGPRLLPIFYAPLLATLLGRRQSAVAVAALAPWLNWLVTGYPRPQTAWLTMLELLVFVLALRGLLTRAGSRWYLAAPAYLAGMLAAAVAVAVHPAFTGGRPAVPWLADTVALGLPGLAILVLINWLVVRTYPQGGNGGGPLAS